MIENAKADVARVGARAIDYAYLLWVSAETECQKALRTWFEGTRGVSATAYFAYVAALDREEAAARELQRLWTLPEPGRESVVHAEP